MSTLMDVIGSLRTELTAQLSLSTQFAGDYDDELETMSAVAVGQAQTMYRIRHQYQTALEGSNVTWKQGFIEIEIAHRLSDAFNERAYTEAAMQTQQLTLLDRAFWRDLTGVYEVEESDGPEVGLDVERAGNVIRWSVVCLVRIVT